MVKTAEKTFGSLDVLVNNAEDASEAMRLASHKLPLRTGFVKRESAAH